MNKKHKYLSLAAVPLLTGALMVAGPAAAGELTANAGAQNNYIYSLVNADDPVRNGIHYLELAE